MIAVMLAALGGFAAGLLSKGPPPDPPGLEREEIIDSLREIVAREEISDTEKRFSLRDIARILYSLEGEE